MEVEQADYTIIQILAEFGFAITAVIGLGYFIYWIWNFISDNIDPKIEEMHHQLIRVIDQVRMLDNDLIRLQEKVDVVITLKENERLKREKQNVDKN